MHPVHNPHETHTHGMKPSTLMDAEALRDDDEEEEGKATALTRSGDFVLPDLDRLNSLLEKLRKADRMSLLSAFLKRRDALKRPNALENYPSVREAYLALHMAMNEKGCIAPAFRDHLRVTKARGLSSAEVLLSRDNQVIDLHYLHCQHRKRVKPNNRKYEPLFKSKEFQLELAGQFAAQAWRAEVKAEGNLRLSTRIQMEMLVLKGEKARRRVRAIREKTDSIRMLLVEHADRPRSRLKDDDITARVDDFTCLMLAAGSPSKAAVYSSLITGTPLPDEPSSLRRLHEKFRKRREWFEEQLGFHSWESKE
jgi:hypothetical protein